MREPLTPAERQRRYRARQAQKPAIAGGSKQYAFQMTLAARDGLKRLAHFYGLTERDTINKVLIDADRMKQQYLARRGDQSAEIDYMTRGGETAHATKISK